MRFFSPTWQKFDAKPVGFPQFRYLFDKDVSPEWGKATYPHLNEGRKMAVRFYWFKAELNNGGLPQYFWNSSGEFTGDQITDLATIGCPDTASILASASQKIFGTERPPIATSERRERIAQYYGTHPFNDDDDHERLSTLEGKDDLRAETDQLRDFQEQIATALCAWFRVHPHYFSRLR